jgi:hypothetical protein
MMTFDEALDLEEGQETNILVAELVMRKEPCSCWSMFSVDAFCGTAYIKSINCPHEAGDCYPQNHPADYTGRMDAAWQVHQKACSWIHSKRKYYLDCLQLAISLKLHRKSPSTWPEGCMIAWQDVLTRLEPIDICRAAIMTEEWRLSEKRNETPND